MKSIESLIGRFMAKVKVLDNGCWAWIGGTAPGGYGEFWVKPKLHKAHRVSYSMFVGDIEDGLDICHKCDNPNCVNPDHLFAGTGKDNMADCVKKGRIAKGERHGGAMLKSHQVEEIVGLMRSGETNKSLSDKYSVPLTTIENIRNGKSCLWLIGDKSTPKSPGSRKLTDDQVLSIFGMKGSGVPQRVIAEQYGIRDTSVCRIWSGKRNSSITKCAAIGGNNG